MMELKNLFDVLKQLESHSSSFNESWGNLTFKGVYSTGTSNIFSTLTEEISALSIQSSLNFFIDTSLKQNVTEYLEEIQEFDKWKVTINKSVLQNDKDENGIVTNFFFSKDKFINWCKSSNPFYEEHPFNSNKYRVIVHALENDFGGPNFVVCRNSSNIQSLDWDQYDENLIYDTIHIISKSKLLIKPQNHFITFGNVDAVSKYFFRNSILILLSCLSSELYETGEIILKGYRRISLLIGLDYVGDEVTSEYQTNLANAIVWIYQKNERCDLRLKLLLERITLDIDFNRPYIQGLYSIINEATAQAKERYSFIIYDRKDLYQKELKDLLKDIKSLTEIFSSKVRGLLSNFLRDILATFVLIGITIFSKVSDITNLFSNGLIKYVFMAFGIYYLFSAVIQLAVDCFDIIRSNTEFNYWKMITREYMSKDDFKTHRKNTLDPRLTGTAILYIFIFILYIAVGITCIYIPEIWPKLINI